MSQLPQGPCPPWQWQPMRVRSPGMLQPSESSPCGGSPPSDTPAPIPGPHSDEPLIDGRVEMAGLATLSNRDIYHYGQRKLFRLGHGMDAARLLRRAEVARFCWRFARSVQWVAAEDRWLVEPSSTRSVRTRARVARVGELRVSWETADFPIALCRLRKGLPHLYGPFSNGRASPSGALRTKRVTKWR